MTDFKNIILDCYHDNTIGSFADAKANGLVGVIHKASQGLTFTDQLYSSRKTEVLGDGLLWGAYHFGTSADPIEQAKHFLSVVGADRSTLLCLDLEPEPNNNSMGTNGAEAFVDYIYKVTGRYPVLYTGKYYIDRIKVSTDSILAKCPLWVASYADEPIIPTQWNTWTLWQYTNGSDGPSPHSLPGTGANDYSIFNGSLDELKAWWIRTNEPVNTVIEPPITNKTVVYSAPGGLNIRSSPEITDNNIVAEIAGNHKLVVLDEVQNGFQRIEGWVSTKYFSKNITIIQKPVVPVPVSSGHTKMGFHLYPPVGDEVMQFIKDMAAIGRPVPGITILKPSNISIQDIKKASPTTKVMARPYVGTDANVNPTNWVNVTQKDGLNWFNNRTRPVIMADWGDLQYADYIQPVINEPGYDKTGTPNFWQGMMDGAKDWFAMGMLCFGIGYPDLDTFWQTNEMKALALRATTVPAVGNKHHVFMVHQYTDPRLPQPRHWDSDFTSLRHKRIMKIDPVYKRVHWVFGEYGDEKMPEHGAEYFIQQVKLADDQLKLDDNVDFASLWTMIASNYDPKKNWGTDMLNSFLPDLATYYKR